MRYGNIVGTLSGSPASNAARFKSRGCRLKTEDNEVRATLDFIAGCGLETEDNEVRATLDFIAGCGLETED